MSANKLCKDDRVHKNIIIIGDLSETHRRPIRDLLETHQRPTGDPSETDMPHRRPTCFIGDPTETNLPHRRPTCLIGDP